MSGARRTTDAKSTATGPGRSAAPWQTVRLDQAPQGRGRTRTAALSLAFALAAAGCQQGLTDAAPLPPLDEPYFRCHVQPILTKNCATYACHGSPDRAFRLYARNRLRFGIADVSQIGAPLGDEERALNFEAARSFVDFGALDQSLLLKKPLQGSAGGFYHGATRLGTSNVFSSVDDAEYQILAGWVNGAVEANPQCIEPGSNQ
jgi:hypothetical protein